MENYANSFGLEWQRYPKTQYDSYSGIKESETRFFNETGWDRDLTGQVILEVGSGSGRFTEQVASTDAFVVSMDYSNAVEANYSSNGSKDNILIVQGDVFSMPFKKKYFDKLFCIGVIQHTPDPEKAFKCLAQFLKPGGRITADIYKKTISAYLGLHYIIRIFTKNLPPEDLYKYSRNYVDFMWPLCTFIRKISPKWGPKINWVLSVPDYSRKGLKGDILKEWAYLDTLDMWSPRHTHPQTKTTFAQWFKDEGFVDVDICYGYNGIEGRGTRPTEKTR
jgi:ubiquinone/menaquinone biosynthesis C-methylase UbiE